MGIRWMLIASVLRNYFFKKIFDIVVKARFMFGQNDGASSVRSENVNQTISDSGPFTTSLTLLVKSMNSISPLVQNVKLWLRIFIFVYSPSMKDFHSLGVKNITTEGGDRMLYL